MPSALENLQTALDNVCAKIAEISASPKPNYSLDGQSFSHADFFRMLLEQQKNLREAIQQAGGPFQIEDAGAGCW